MGRTKESMRWKACCKSEIKAIWDLVGGSMNLVHYTGECHMCGQFIGLTQTSEADAKIFLEESNEPQKSGRVEKVG